MSDFGPQITAARFFRKKSKNGATYFTGRIGMMKAALLKANELADDGSEIWNLVLSEAPTKPAASPADPHERRRRSPRPITDVVPASEARPFDDHIPFLAA